MKEVNFKEFHDFLVSIGKRTVKIVRRWGVGSPLLPLSHYGNGGAKAILKCSNVMYLHCYNFYVQNAAIEPQCIFRYAGRAKEVYFVDPPARFINISEIVILEQGSLLAPSSLLLSGTVLFLLSNITDFCSQVFSLFVCYFVAWCLLPPFQFLSFHVLIDQCLNG